MRPSPLAGQNMFCECSFLQNLFSNYCYLLLCILFEHRKMFTRLYRDRRSTILWKPAWVSVYVERLGRSPPPKKKKKIQFKSQRQPAYIFVRCGLWTFYIRTLWFMNILYSYVVVYEHFIFVSCGLWTIKSQSWGELVEDSVWGDNMHDSVSLILRRRRGERRRRERERKKGYKSVEIRLEKVWTIQNVFNSSFLTIQSDSLRWENELNRAEWQSELNLRAEHTGLDPATSFVHTRNVIKRWKKWYSSRLVS